MHERTGWHPAVHGGGAAYLQHKVSVWGQLEVQVLVVQMFSEGQQELILPADVCSQDERAQLLFHVLPAEGGGHHWANQQRDPAQAAVILCCEELLYFV